MLTRLLDRLLFAPHWRVLGHFLLGLAIGVLFHYLLYRISLPVQPFIYVAF